MLLWVFEFEFSVTTVVNKEKNKKICIKKKKSIINFSGRIKRKNPVLAGLPGGIENILN